MSIWFQTPTIQISTLDKKRASLFSSMHFGLVFPRRTGFRAQRLQKERCIKRKRKVFIALHAITHSHAMRPD